MTPDYTKAFAEMMDAMPADMTAMTDAFRTSAAFGEKLSKVALTAAEQSAELSSAWTKETLSNLADVAAAKEDPAEYTKAASDFAAASLEATTENVAAFAEIAKRVQMETLELMMASGKEAAAAAAPAPARKAPARKAAK
jgi:hypothetical protein